MNTPKQIIILITTYDFSVMIVDSENGNVLDTIFLTKEQQEKYQKDEPIDLDCFGEKITIKPSEGKSFFPWKG